MPKELKEILSECMREAGSVEDLAERLTSAGVVYAPVEVKVAEKIFTEIEEIIDKHYNNHIFNNKYDLEDEEKEAVINFSDDVTYDIDKLKKKYTEGKDE